MTLTKNQIVNQVIETIGFTNVKSTETVELLLEIIKRSLEDSDDVLVSNFGKFQVKEKSQRKGRNPATGGTMMLPPRRVVTFKPAVNLRDQINGTK